MEHRTLPVWVRERDVIEGNQPRGPFHDDRADGLDDGRGRVEHLDDPLRAGLSARYEDDHEHRGHHCEEDLHDVLQERRQVADRHVSTVDQTRAEPEDGDGREIHDREKRWKRDGEDPVNAKGRRGEVGVRRLKPRPLRTASDERPHHPDTGDLLAHHLRDPIDLELHLPEERDGPQQEDPDDGRHERNDHDKQP